MGTPINVPILGEYTLNTSGAYDITLGLSSRIIVERNGGSPAGDAVNVVFDTVTIGALSSITVQNASLTIDSLATVNALTTYNIGNSGTLDLSSTIGVNLLSPINFTGVGGRLVLDAGLNVSLLSNVTGFDSDDVLSFNDVSSATDVRYENGEIRVYDGDTVVARADVSGNFDGDALGFQSDGQGGINVGVGLGNGGGDPNDNFVNGLHSEYIIAQTPLGQLYLQDKVPGRDGSATIADAKYIVFADGVARFDASGAAQDVTHLYQAAFDRRPDAVGLEYWTGRLESSDLTEAQIASSFSATPEFATRYGALDNAGYVNQLYQNVLGRAGETSGVEYWTSELNSGARDRGNVLMGFSDSIENIENSLSFTGDREYGAAYRLYEAALNREPEAVGLAYWYERLEGGDSLTNVAQGFVDSQEFGRLYGTLDNSSFVSQLYQNVLDRPGDQVGQEYWTGVLENGGSRADVLVGFSDSLEARILTADATHDSWVFLGAA
ncbi:hypothetical protein HMPREF9946_00709 [Acetobacteraceae bacterium AT-5844]|nr:hypothetical protein HMPREF9946_00709 [Acetobacteraceae bacterium AT-5844]